MNNRYAALAAILLPLARCITPEQMISAPRYSPAIPNPSGEWAFYTSKNYSFEKHEASTTWKLLHLPTGDITDLPWNANVSEAVWVGPTNTSVLYVNTTNPDTPGGVTLYTLDLVDAKAEPHLVASLPAPYAGLKAATTSSDDINFVINCLAYANNGSAYNEELATKPAHKGMLYEAFPVTYLDSYIPQERYAIFSGVLKKSSNPSGYTFDGTTKNLLRNLNYNVTRPESPQVGNDRDPGDYDLSPDGSLVAFLTLAPDRPKGIHTVNYIYLVPHDGSSAPEQLNGPGSKAPVNSRGFTYGPKFSPDGRKVAYSQQDDPAYGWDRFRLYVADVGSKEVHAVAEDWGYSVDGYKWTPGSKELYAKVDYYAATRLFPIPADAPANYKPTNVTGATKVRDFFFLPDGKALVSADAAWASFLLYTVAPDGDTHYYYKSNERDSELVGLGPHDIDSYWYEGTLGDQQQAFMVFPTNFDPKKVYSMAFIVHGGPQSFAGSLWSTRWNFKTWADQGYIVVLPNPTGSTSYGQALTDRIQGEWGGLTYDDLVNAHKYACDNFQYINCSNSIGAGASFGGYMMNWIQGRNLGRQFKALVNHDGVTSTYSLWAQDGIDFAVNQFNGTLFEQPGRSVYDRWDPLQYASNWSTPMFVIHSEKDYRIPISEGFTVFTVLQYLGVPSRFLKFSDEGHYITHPENSLFWHQEIFNWINYWTGKIDKLSDNAITQ
ncbi:uncharacterized protein RHO25_003421 [Cercospora beticola]|uniref:Dipeptidyl-peptidase V n=2 Tax=Cercospora beticola TaxID=122368 RepID=A0ABZ0NGZ2_CERBT|nr:hypothetical protein RHO25_003421 [Cercospora beticola]